MVGLSNGKVKNQHHQFLVSIFKTESKFSILQNWIKRRQILNFGKI